MNITLEHTREHTKHIVTNMFVAYLLDTASYSDDCVINEHGLPVWGRWDFPSPRTHDDCVRHNWWIRDRCERYIVRADGTPAGFVILLTDPLHLPPGVDVELMDFYITPKYRGQGVGRTAARAAFDLHHGCWQVEELARNEPAIRFWHSVIREYTHGEYQDGKNGTQQRFRNE